MGDRPFTGLDLVKDIYEKVVKDIYEKRFLTAQSR